MIEITTMAMQFMPIVTISNGDCLFAAYAIAAGLPGRREWGAVRSSPWQRMSAIDLRRLTTNFMRRTDAYRDWVVQGRHITDFKFLKEDHAPIMDALRKLRNNASYDELLSSYNLVGYEAPDPGPTSDPRQIIAAYSNIMALPGVWAGVLELKALAMMYQRDIYIKMVGGGLNLSKVVTIASSTTTDILTFDPDIGLNIVPPRKGPVVYMLSDGGYAVRGSHYTALQPIQTIQTPPPGAPMNARGNARRNNGPRNNARRNNGSRNGMANNNAQRRMAVNALMRQQQQQQQQRNGNGSGSGVGSMTAMYVIAGAVSVLLSSIRAAF